MPPRRGPSPISPASWRRVPLPSSCPCRGTRRDPPRSAAAASAPCDPRAGARGRGAPRLRRHVRGPARARAVPAVGAKVVVSGGGTRRLLGVAVERARPALGCRDADELRRIPARIAREAAPGTIGLVQFSSGSTVDPKPVALTHAALAAPADVLVSWLPLYHDMGLIAALLGAMSYPGPLVLVPPEHFLAKPALWLRAIARHRGTISAAPSFAYAYAADRVKDQELSGRSLATWRLAYDGAESISADAMRRFATRFEAHGFDPGAFVPSYGLAEATLAVTSAPRGRPLAGRRVDPVRLATEG